MAAAYDLPEIRRGNSFSLGFRFKGSDTQPVDLTGSIIIFSIEASAGVLRKRSDTPDSGCEITDAAGGAISIALTPAETRSLKLGRGTRYEIERRVGDNQTTVIAGAASVIEGINDDD